MLSLSIADQYHLQIKMEMAPETTLGSYKFQLLLPSAMENDSDSSVNYRFYRNLIQSQYLQPISLPNRVDLSAECRRLRNEGALTKLQFRIVLANITNGLLQLYQKSEGQALLGLRSILFQFLRLQDRINEPHNKRLYKLARQLILFRFHQALLRERHGGQCDDLAKTKRVLKLVERYAYQLEIKLSGCDDAKRERMLEKLTLSKRIVDRPYTVTHQQRRNSKFAEQIIFGFAAALAMAFATGIAFATQKTFGNFSTPFFFSLVFSYIFKDRFKELGRKSLLERYYVRFYQHCSDLFTINSKRPFAELKDTFYQLKQIKTEKLRLKLKRHLSSSEQTRMGIGWVYQRQCRVRNKYRPESIKFIDDLTFNFSQVLRRLPIDTETIWQASNNQATKVQVNKVVPIYLLLEAEIGEESSFLVYRLHASRKGFHRIKQLS